MIALTLALAVGVGITLGLLGGGGSIMMVPLLVYVAGVDVKSAIPLSLLVIGISSAVAVIPHARARRVRWSVAAMFGTAAVVGAYSGGRMAYIVPGSVLLIIFAVLMIAAGAAMVRGYTPVRNESGGRAAVGVIVLQGVVVGVISGLIGAGGGFLLVPALVLLGGVSMPTAVGTSLVVITMQSGAGLLGHLAHHHIDWRLAGLLTLATVVGSVIGSHVTSYIAPILLRKIFGWGVVVMAAVVLAGEIRLWVGIGVVLVACAVALYPRGCSWVLNRRR